MKRIGYISFLMGILSSCSSPKTIFISNKTGTPITLLVDATYATTNAAFRDSLSGLAVEKKEVFNFGDGKWTTQDKADLELLLAHSKILNQQNNQVPAKVTVSYITLGVEELWIVIK